MRKMIMLYGMLTLVLLINGSVSLGVDRPIDKKLGYGFAPGLVPGKDFIAGQLIVGLKEGMGTDEIKQAAVAAGIPVAKEIKGALLLQFTSEQAVTEAIPVLTGRTDVAFVERNGFMRIPPKPTLAPSDCGKCNRSKRGIDPASVSPDPGTGYQWHLTVIRKTAADLPALSSTPPTVAVIDTGVDYTHPDLAGKVLLGKNCIANTMDPMDDYGHGTHCAGIIAAKAENNMYGEGVCPNCKILAVKVLNYWGEGSFFDIAEGMAYVLSVCNSTSPPTKVVSMSLGSEDDSSLIKAKVTEMKNAGLVLAASAGNGNTIEPHYPAAYAETALRVMATNWMDCRAWFSNFSPKWASSRYNIAAPGVYIFSTYPWNGFMAFDGTSMSTPVVAGAAALVWGQVPTLTRTTLVSRLLANAQTTTCGFPVATKRVDVRAAILETSETAVLGHLFDAFTGLPTSPTTTPITVQLRSGSSLLASDAANLGGTYEMSGLTAGTGRSLRALKTGYIATTLRSPVTIGAGLVNGPFFDALVKARPTGDASLVLDWKTMDPWEKDDAGACTGPCLGYEFDLWLKDPSGTYYGDDHEGALSTPPYIFYPRNSYSNVLFTSEACVPMETIIIGDPASNGVYKVFVDRYVSSSRFNQTYAGSQIQFQVFNGTIAIPGAVNLRCPCTTQQYWYIGDINKSDSIYTWTSKNLCPVVKP